MSLVFRLGEEVVRLEPGHNVQTWKCGFTGFDVSEKSPLLDMSLKQRASILATG